MQGDNIDYLPTDNTLPTHFELEIMNNLFRQNKNSFDSILEESKDLFLLFFLFIILSLPKTNEILKKIIHIDSEIILVGLKSVILVTIYWLVKNFYLSKKSSKAAKPLENYKL